METTEALQLIREHALQQCRVIVAKTLPTTSDPRNVYQILDQINFLIAENSKKS